MYVIFSIWALLMSDAFEIYFDIYIIVLFLGFHR